jgi:hypothetical protein
MDNGLGSGIRRVVAVEGVSDRSALSTLALRTGRDLDAEGVIVVAMGGATNIGHFLDQYGPRGLACAMRESRATSAGRLTGLAWVRTWSSAGSSSASLTWRTS